MRVLLSCIVTAVFQFSLFNDTSDETGVSKLKAVLNVFFFFASFKLPLFNEYEMVFIIA